MADIHLMIIALNIPGSNSSLKIMCFLNCIFKCLGVFVIHDSWFISSTIFRIRRVRLSIYTANQKLK